MATTARDTRCRDCGAERKQGALDPIRDLWERVDAGEPFPAGQCPDCGALAHLLDDDSDVATTAEIEQAESLYCIGSDNTIEIDDDALASRGEDGVWVQAWVFLPKGA